MTIRILEKEYPLAYTIMAQEAIAKRHGGLEKWGETMESIEVDDMMGEMAFMAAEMTKGAYEREKVRCKIYGEEYTGPGYLTEEEIKAATQNGEMKEIAIAVMKAMKEGNEATVEVKEEKGKNAKTTPSK